MLCIVAFWCQVLPLGWLPWHWLLWGKDELIDMSAAGGMNIWRALKDHNEVCSYLSSSRHEKVRSDPAASVLTLKVLGPQFGNSCAGKAESHPVNQRTSQTNSQTRCQCSVIYDCLLLPSSVSFCWQDSRTPDSFQLHHRIFSIYSSFFLPLLLQRPYVKSSWLLFTFHENKTKNIKPC